MTSQEEQAYLEEIERVIKAGPYHADWNSLVFTKAVWNFYPLGVV